MRTPKDFDYLHDIVFEQCHAMVSSSTLKRIWGYNRDGGSPRTSSLTPLVQLIGYENWKQFVEETRGGKQDDDEGDQSHGNGSHYRHPKWRRDKAGPYNILCPMTPDGQETWTGCVATLMHLCGASLRIDFDPVFCGGGIPSIPPPPL